MIASIASLEGHIPAAIVEETGPRPGANRIPNVLLFYATRDGQSRRIAAHIAARLAERGICAPLRDLAGAFPALADLAAAPSIAVVAAVRYGRHLPEAERFFATYTELLARVPFAFVSVNLAARKPGRDTAAGNQYLRKLMARHRLKPALAAAVAGRLDYPHYRWLDRQIIRLIMKMTGGPTDPRSCVEFTVWEAVDDIAAQIADLHGYVSNRGKNGDSRPA
jgi:menaquinone-dependent protoporphyrinogen oxidase